MPDLAELLAAEARRLPAPTAPPFDTLVVRARRRRQRQVVGSVLGVVAVVAAAVGVPALVRSGRTTVIPAAPTPSATADPAAALPVSPGVYARLREIALGAERPTRLEAVAVPDVLAADHTMSGDGVSGQGGPGYVIEAQGHFLCEGCTSLKGGPPVFTTVQYSILRAGSFTPEGDGATNTWVDLHRLGAPFSLAAPATASPVPIVTVSQVVPSLPPATESAGPAAPDPKTLAEAEARTKAATIHPDKATIDVAAKVTAGQLRIAGLVIPAAVPDSRPMFLVVVTGQPIFPAGVDKDGTRVGRFAVVFSTGGSGLGAQAVFHGAFGLPDLKGAPAAIPTVVDADKLAPGANLGFTAAPAQATAVSAKQAVAAAGAQSLARPLAALVYIDTVHVTHRLAWVVQTDCLPLVSSSPQIITQGSRTYLATSQVVIDATTGKRLVSASFGMAQP